MLDIMISLRLRRPLNSIRIGATLVILSAILSGCGAESASVPEVQEGTLSDGIGRVVRIREPALRAVSLAPDVTELIFAAGAGDRLVGVTSFCDFPEAARSVEKVGDTQTPSIEKIVALQPDVVFVSTASQLQSFMEVLEKQHISVYVVNSRELEDVPRNVQKLGAILGVERQASVNAQDLWQRIRGVDERLNEFRNRPVPVPVPRQARVFIQISNEPLFTVGEGSILLDVVGRTGGYVTTRHIPTPYPRISKESAMVLEPDVIILSDSEDNREPNVVFKNSPAVKNGRVYRINADILSRPGPRLVDALEQISEFLLK